MADTAPALPPEDEDPLALLQDSTSYLEQKVPGLDLSSAPAGLLRAQLAAIADEDAVQYALLREAADDDWARDLGRLFGVPDPQPAPATTTTSWTARADRDGFLLAGQQLIIDAVQGRIAFEVLQSVEIPAGQTVSGVVVQALTAGAAANGAVGNVLFDESPAWLAVPPTVDQPARDGADELTSAEYLQQVREAAQDQHRAPVNDVDLERRLPKVVPACARALVLDNFDCDTEAFDQEGIVSAVLLDAQGTCLTGAETLKQVQAAVSGPNANRILGGVVKLGTATYTTIRPILKVALEDGVLEESVDPQVHAALAQELSPAHHGQPSLGEYNRWRNRRFLRRYRVQSAVDALEGIDGVVELQLQVVPGSFHGTPTDMTSSVESSGDVRLSGYAPLPFYAEAAIEYVAADYDPDVET